MIALLALAALAQEPAAPVRVRIAVDDREQRRLVAPRVEVRSQAGIDPVRLTDDGAVAGDVPGDRIVVAAVDVARAETLRFAVTDQGRELGSFDVSLPADGGVSFALKTLPGDPPLAVDTRAPAMPDAPAAAGAGPDAPDGAAAAAADRIAVRVVVDDRALQRLHQPRVAVDQAGVEPAALRDDGALDGDEAGDRIYVADLDVARAQYLGLKLVEGSVPVGELSVFLPSSDEAEVRVQTVDGSDGIRLVTEPVSTGSTDTPAAGTAAAAGGGADRLVHVLWVGIALFAMGFAYLRSVMARRYEEEVRPLLHRMERFLDAQEAARPGLGAGDEAGDGAGSADAGGEGAA